MPLNPYDWCQVFLFTTTPHWPWHRASESQVPGKERKIKRIGGRVGVSGVVLVCFQQMNIRAKWQKQGKWPPDTSQCQDFPWIVSSIADDEGVSHAVTRGSRYTITPSPWKRTIGFNSELVHSVVQYCEFYWNRVIFFLSKVMRAKNILLKS